MEACHYSYCLSTCFMQNYIISDCYIRSLEYPNTTGSALDGAVFDTAQILAYLVHNMSRSQLYLGFGHFGWLPSFFGQ